ncbi:hypothetical protein HD553DRAFT_347031 [Filobasidium floriforme]|uniref:uncharacterized protein n=1 Tax=Filobasidium floriforme TaxID=5210 RepID=UPI001E8DCD75|nr:uncharacterized protein HD553DRAFT_347031 [Filobasidium floriforme]KAH8090550.1 hypothetical protein HD553DRAFT_347031 [Filobasidium floriforme]
MDPEIVVNQVDLHIGLASVRQALTGVIHAILFQRSLGAIQMVTEEIMECHIAMLSDDLVAESVNEKVETFYRHIKNRQPAQDGSLGQVAVLLSQKRSKKTWFSSTEEQVPFEVHLITLYSPTTRLRARPTSEEKTSLSNAIMKISKFGVEKCSHVPVISSANSSFPFPYEIVLDPPNTSQHALLNSAEPMSPGSSRTRSDVSIPYGSSPRTSTMTSDSDRRTRELSSRSTSSKDNRQGHLSLSPARVASAPSSTATALGYLEQAKGGLMTVGEKLGLS